MAVAHSVGGDVTFQTEVVCWSPFFGLSMTVTRAIFDDGEIDSEGDFWIVLLPLLSVAPASDDLRLYPMAKDEVAPRVRI